jgi:Iron-sulfur cluster-binding domain
MEEAVESIYYVLSWLCHRTCPHCYEDRFRPYHGAGRDRVAGEAHHNFARIIANFPARMTYHDRAAGGAGKTGTVILSGGEVLLDPIREPVLYPALELLWKRYEGEVNLVVQTTGDLVTARIVRELLERHVAVISVSGVDHYHAGLEREEDQAALRGKLTAIFEGAGMSYGGTREDRGPAPRYHFFGATPDVWIGRLWPRGRAWSNGLSTADITENFCNRWSGGLGFLDYGFEGSEVSVDPAGDVFPCCVKTRLAIGNLLAEPLEDILRRRASDPVYQAISSGQPQRMGLTHGWSEGKFIEMSRTIAPDGQPYANLCIGCDRFHQDVLGAPSPLIAIGE